MVGPEGCLLSVISTNAGFTVVVLAGAHVKAVGTVVSGAIVNEIFSDISSAPILSVCSVGRCCVVALVLGLAACTVPNGEWVCVAFCSGAFVLAVFFVNRVFMIELVVGE